MPKRTTGYFLALLALSFFLLGMGDMGAGSEKTPRRPQENFTATVTDRSQNKLAVTHVHCEGKTSIKGYLGEMRLTLTFAKIKQVDFSPATSGYVDGTVRFRDGEPREFRFKNLTRCYGDADVGQLMIRLRDLKQIVFDDANPAAPEAGQ
ncbi:MAG: hypothetical protein GX444_17510 [Myxococcales bacterium]|nr:hypothetical protein [Myxococcales bacterium]